MLSRLKPLVPLSLLALLAGCEPPVIGTVAPDPIVDLPRVGGTIGIRLGPDVKDAYPIPQQSGIRSFQVEGWHLTMTTGFVNTFDEAFDQTTMQDGDYVVEFTAAKFDFTLAAVRETGGAVAVRGRVKYAVRLLDSSGQVIARTSGETITSSTAANEWETSNLMAEATALMWSQVSEELLNHLVGGAGPATTPAPSVAPNTTTFCCASGDATTGKECKVVQPNAVAACMEAGSHVLSCSNGFSGSTAQITCNAP